MVEAPVRDLECLSPGGVGSAHSRHRRVWALVYGTPCRHPALLANLLFESLYSLPPLSSGLNERTTYRTQECLGLSEPGTYRQHIPRPECQSSSRGRLRPIFVLGFREPLSTWA